MEITRTQRFSPLLQFQVAPSSSTLSHHLGRSLLHHSQRSTSSLPPLLVSLTHLNKTPLSVVAAAAADGSASVSTVGVDDHSLALKKMAMDVSPELKGTTIFLVGMRSSIKTRLGELLANLLRYYYFDSDNLVEEAAGTRSLRQADKTAFAESETEVLKQLSSMGRLVVCAGDGATQSSTNLALLRHGITIWIDVPLDIVARSVVEDQSQLLAYNLSTSVSYPEVLSHLTTSFEELRVGYAIADATVSIQHVAGKLGYDEVDNITTEDLALEVLKEIEKLIRVKKMVEAAARPF